MHTAPVIIVPFAHKQAYLDRYAEPDKGFPANYEARWRIPHWYVDTAYASMTMLLSVVDAGLGAIFFSVRDPAPLREAFGVPDGFDPIGAIAIAPSDPNVIYVGTPSAGLWRSMDGGNSWQALFTDLPSMGVSGIVVDPQDPNVIYIATGDGDGADTYSAGVLKIGMPVEAERQHIAERVEIGAAVGVDDALRPPGGARGVVEAERLPLVVDAGDSERRVVLARREEVERRQGPLGGALERQEREGVERGLPQEAVDRHRPLRVRLVAEQVENALVADLVLGVAPLHRLFLLQRCVAVAGGQHRRRGGGQPDCTHPVHGPEGSSRILGGV